MDFTVFDEMELKDLFADMLQNMNESQKQIFIDYYGSMDAWEHEFCIVLYYKIRPTHHALSRACADGLAAWAPYALTDSQADIPPGWSLQKHRISQPDRQRKVL